MNRFHVHMAVEDLDANLLFYGRLFGREPDVRKADYAKWMLDDPRLNFAISSRGATPGVNHLGLQAEDAEELAVLEARARAADANGVEERDAACCYASGNKYWVTDPQGIAWEHFHTLGDIPVFGSAASGSGAPETKGGCCTPAAAAPPKACCAPATDRG
jgi:hypothetical protein